MKLVRGLIVFSGFLLNSILADSVVDLSDSDFESSVAQYDTSLVMFYAPWYASIDLTQFICYSTLSVFFIIEHNILFYLLGVVIARN